MPDTLISPPDWIKFSTSIQKQNLSINMKFSTISALAVLASLTLAAPIDPPRNSPGRKVSRFSQVDITILQFALTVR